MIVYDYFTNINIGIANADIRFRRIANPVEQDINIGIANADIQFRRIANPAEQAELALQMPIPL